MALFHVPWSTATTVPTTQLSADSLRLDIINGLSAAPGQGDIGTLKSDLEKALARVHDMQAAASQTRPVAVIGGGLSGLTASLRLLTLALRLLLSTNVILWAVIRRRLLLVSMAAKQATKMNLVSKTQRISFTGHNEVLRT